MRNFILPFLLVCLGLGACAPAGDKYVRSTTDRPYPMLTDGTDGAEAQTYKAQTLAPPSAALMAPMASTVAPARAKPAVTPAVTKVVTPAAAPAPAK